MDKLIYLDNAATTKKLHLKLWKQSQPLFYRTLWESVQYIFVCGGK